MKSINNSYILHTSTNNITEIAYNIEDITKYVLSIENYIANTAFIGLSEFEIIEKKITELKLSLTAHQIKDSIQKKDSNTTINNKEFLSMRIDWIITDFLQPISRKFAQKKEKSASKNMDFFNNETNSNNIHVRNKKNLKEIDMQLHISNIKINFFSSNSRDLWQYILSYITIEDHRRLAQVNKFFRNRVNDYPLPKKGYIIVTYKKLLKIVNLAVFHARLNQIQATEKDLGMACKPGEQRKNRTIKT